MNLSKYEIVPFGEVVYVNELASNLGCHVSSLLLKIFGLALGAPLKARYIWDPILERMHKILASLKKLCV